MNSKLVQNLDIYCLKQSRQIFMSEIQTSRNPDSLLFRTNLDIRCFELIFCGRFVWKWLDLLDGHSFAVHLTLLSDLFIGHACLTWVRLSLICLAALSNLEWKISASHDVITSAGTSPVDTLLHRGFVIFFRALPPLLLPATLVDWPVLLFRPRGRTELGKEESSKWVEQKKPLS